MVNKKSNRQTQNIQVDNVNKNNKTNKKYEYRNEVVLEEAKAYYLIPVFIILCIIPLLTKYVVYKPKLSQYAWYFNSTDVADLFLYVKQQWFVMLSFVTAFAVVIKAFTMRKSKPYINTFIPLAAYAVLAFLSAIFSKYRSFCFTGSTELFESILVILGYCIIVYYIYLFVNKEKDFKWIFYFIIGISLVFSILGVFQFIGKDFFQSQFAFDMVVPSDIRDKVDKFSFNFGKGIVYLTLYNPNYVGVYGALIIPVLTVMAFFQRKPILIILTILSIIGLSICTIGSQSLSGIIGLGTAVVAIAIFMWRYLYKKLYVTIAVIVFVIVGIFAANILTNNYISNKIVSALNLQKEHLLLSDIYAVDDGVLVTYNGYEMKVQASNDENVNTAVYAYDKNNKLVTTLYDASTNGYVVTDPRFAGIIFGWDTSYPGAFYINIEGISYRFTHLTSDGKYSYINAYNREDKIVKAPSALFSGYEKAASGRGYIWSRTIPLLGYYTILGSGPDTYTMVFPQQDYMNLARYGFAGQLLTKPHSMYLQMAVQTGVLSLIAFLIFYGMYFVSSIRLYLQGRFKSFYTQMGLGIFIGTLCYMVTGITNDSNINTAPTFWTLMGVGIALNCKVKPLIEAEKNKEKQQEKVE